MLERLKIVVDNHGVCASPIASAAAQSVPSSFRLLIVEEGRAKRGVEA